MYILYYYIQININIILFSICKVVPVHAMKSERTCGGVGWVGGGES